MSAHAHRHQSRISIDMPSKEHKKLKAMAAIYGVTIKDLVLSCLRESLLSEGSPNAETLKAFRETDEGKGLISCDDFEDFVEKLDI
ncbi:MAG: hypothetical protein ACE5GN_03090 [Waddliaceae bacterium]